MTTPNVLFVVLDAVRKDHLGPYGYERPTTPVLDDFAAEATRYDHAVAAAPWTPSSHGAMFSGQYPSTSGIYGRTPHYSDEVPHVAERMADRGYHTAGFSNSYHTGPEREFDRGFEYFHDILSLPRFADTMYEPSLDFARHLVDYFGKGYDDSAFQLRRLKTQVRRSDDPFFGFINFNSAHSPYDPPGRFKSEFEAYFDDWDAVDEDAAEVVSEDAYKAMLGDVEVTETEWDLLRCWYDGEIRYLDHLLGSLFEFLRDRGVYDETAIVVTADHGEQFGEDGLVYHQFTLAERLINVPLLVKWPEGRGPDPGTSDELVSLVDLAPTAIDLAGGTVPDTMDGRSLLSDGAPTEVFAEYAGPNQSIRDRFRERGTEFEPYLRGLQAVRTREHKLVRATDGEETLYELGDLTETAVDDERRHAELAGLFDRLDPPPTDDTDGEVADHVARHLEEMGYK
jgi:arylsulfatase A-like enzyme